MHSYNACFQQLCALNCITTFTSIEVLWVPISGRQWTVAPPILWSPPGDCVRRFMFRVDVRAHACLHVSLLMCVCVCVCTVCVYPPPQPPRDYMQKRTSPQDRQKLLKLTYLFL